MYGLQTSGQKLITTFRNFKFQMKLNIQDNPKIDQDNSNVENGSNYI